MKESSLDEFWNADTAFLLGGAELHINGYLTTMCQENTTAVTASNSKSLKNE